MILSLFDASSLVHTGIKANTRPFVVENFPVNGIKHALRYIIPQGIKKGLTLVCFDSPTDRKSLLPGYKSNRSKLYSSEVNSQLELLKKILDDAGVPTLKVDGYEADDLIFSAVEKYRGVYNEIHIYSSDKDLAHNVDLSVSLFAVNSLGVDVDWRTYRNSVTPDRSVPLGAITLHKLFKGDASDSVLSFHPVGKIKKDDMYKALIAPLTGEKAGDPFIGTKESYLRDTLDKWYEAGLLVQEDYDALDIRIKVLYPRLYDGDIPVSRYASNPLTIYDYSLAEYCELFRENRLVQMLGATHAEISQETRDVLVKYGKIFNSGAFGFSRSINPNKAPLEYSRTELRAFDLFS